MEEPVQRNLGNGLAGLGGDFIQGVDHFVEIFIFDLRTLRSSFVQTALRRQWMAAADFAGQASPAQRTPDDGAYALIDAQRHQLPLVVTTDYRVVDLVGYVT